MPLKKQALPIAEVVDGVNADDRIERVRLERELGLCVCNSKVDVIEGTMLCCLLTCKNALLVDVDSRKSAPVLAGEVKGRATCTAGYFQDVRRWRKLQPGVEGVVLVGSDPTVLTDIQSVRLGANISEDSLVEVTVGAVIQVYVFCHAPISGRQPGLSRVCAALTGLSRSNQLAQSKPDTSSSGSSS